MKKLLLALLLIGASTSIFSQEITFYYFGDNGKLVGNSAKAKHIVKKEAQENGELVLTYLSRDKEGWVKEPRHTFARKIADNRWEELYYEDSIAQSRIYLELVKEEGKLMTIRETDDTHLLTEATVTNLFPRLYTGMCTRYAEDKTKTVELYRENIRYDLVVPPDASAQKAMEKASIIPAWYPGGSNQFLSDMIRLAKVPDEKIDEHQKKAYRVNLTVSKDGLVTEATFDGLKDAEVAEALKQAAQSNPQSWFPATKEGAALDYHYQLPFILFKQYPLVADADANDQVVGKTDANEKEEKIDKMPEFRGGEQALRSFIATNLGYPKTAQQERIQGKVFVSFVVDPWGFVQQIKVARGVHPLLDREAMRVVRLMPQWTPGIKDGKTARVKYTVPISFRLN